MSISAITESEAVRTVVASVPHCIDGRRWPALRALFAEVVETDYRSLVGGEVEQQKGDDLIEAWRKLLTPLGATQHLLGPITVTLAEGGGNHATAECHVRGYHFKKGAAGGDEWMVAGHYVFALAREDGHWKIRSLGLQTLYQTGNLKLLEQAGS